MKFKVTGYFKTAADNVTKQIFFSKQQGMVSLIAFSTDYPF